MTNAIAKDEANACFDAIVEIASADESHREPFVTYMTSDADGPKEYRFMGTLGFGGKAYLENEVMRVNCYSEHRNPDANMLIVKLNARLAHIQTEQRLQRFMRRVSALADGDKGRISLLLQTKRERDGKSALDWLRANDFRKAFSAVMDAASPRPNMPKVEDRPLLWYDKPSIAVEDLHLHDK